MERDDLLSRLYGRIDSISSEVSEIKSMLQEIESLSTKDQREAKIHKSSSMCFQFGERKSTHDNQIAQREEKF